MAASNFDDRRFEAGSVFTPGAPINELDLFAGRQKEIEKIVDAVSQKGLHAVLFGDRGVGKTSLANILGAFVQRGGQRIVFPRTNADPQDTFSSLWRRVLQDIEFEHTRSGLGFTAEEQKSRSRFIDSMPSEIRPDDVRRALTQLGQFSLLIVCIDEFDRLQNPEVAETMSDTIKALSDAAVPATVLLIGVADSVDNLITDHRSIERSLVQIPMPRMSADETRQIVENGLQRLKMKAEETALKEISELSQGLPYITHLLALHSVRAALRAKRLTVCPSDVEDGIQRALDNWQQSIITAYYEATKSPQPGHLYKEVLLACALAEVDEKNYFTAAAVRTPLRLIARPDLDIPNFSRHLKEFSDDRRGNILTREGETRRFRYRFVSPLMRPYIIMRGFSDQLLTKKIMSHLKA